MPNVILWMHQSVDGFFEGPNHEFDWPIVYPALQRHFIDQQRAVGAFLYGRRVYEMMAGYWPTADVNPASPEDAEYGRIWKEKPKIVFSKTLDQAGWGTRVIKENIAEEIATLKAQSDGDLVLYGGADIASTFIKLGLIDEYHIFVHPVVLGGGTPLFPALTERIKLTLVEARTFDPGVVLHRYQRASAG